MVLKRAYIYNIGIFLLLVAFVAFKWQFLDLPLYWDEAWVYGPAVKAMHSNGLSILPNTIGTELSRGHPLLFHFLAAVWSFFFGPSNISLHTFSLVLSTILLFLVYHVGSKLGSRQIGTAAVLLVGLNEIFLAQSGILLPEVALGLFFLLAVSAFISRNVIGYIIAATCALFIKESAIVLIIALSCWQLISTIADKPTDGLRSTARWQAIILSPLLPAFLFLLYQRITYGWFFFPVHLGLISLDIQDIHYLFKFEYRKLFEQQGMEWATLAFGLIAPLAWKGWKRRYTGLLVVFMYVAAIKVLDGKWTLPPLSTLIVTLICFGAILFLQFFPLWRQEGRRGEFVSISLIFILGFLLFSSLNFFSDRYLTGMVPFVALGMSAVLYSALAPWHRVLFPAIIILITGNLFWHIGKDGLVGDTRLSYADDIRVHQQMIAECESLELHHARFYGSFMDITYMTDPNAGYLTGDISFEHISNSMSSEIQYALVSQESPRELQTQLSPLGFVLVMKYRSGPAWCALYKRQNDVGTPDIE